jgi:hypothetical protein
MAKQLTFSVTKVEAAKKMLFSLPKKEPERLDMDPALVSLKPAIEASLKHGYSLSDIAGQLAKAGVPVPVFKLKAFLGLDAKKEQ